MYIIVVGGGRVGYYLTKALLEEGHEVLIIEKDKVICDNINEELGSICLRGDGCEATVLAEAGTERADMLVAVTGNDQDNLVSCQIAKHKFNVKLTISRIRNPKNEILFKKLGIDVTINSTNAILEAITELVPTHTLTHLHTVRDKGLNIVEIKIPDEAITTGKKIKELSIPYGCTLILVISKKHSPQIPSPETVIEGDAQIIAITPPEAEEALRTALLGS